jgi:RNA polymerase sigma-70 factor, ECF subfamily
VVTSRLHLEHDRLIPSRCCCLTWAFDIQGVLGRFADRGDCDPSHIHAPSIPGNIDQLVGLRAMLTKALRGDGLKRQVCDAEVRAAVAAGDLERAATAVIADLGAEVYGFVRASLDNDHDADDVFAETCTRLWRGLGDFAWRCSVRTWVYVIARNEIARFARGSRRRRHAQATPSRLDEVAAKARTETLSVLRAPKIDKLRALRDELPTDDRMLLVLRVDRDLSWEDVALAFLGEDCDLKLDEIARETARLRKRFQLIRRRLASRARDEGLVS